MYMCVNNVYCNIAQGTSTTLQLQDALLAQAAKKQLGAMRLHLSGQTQHSVAPLKRALPGFVELAQPSGYPFHTQFVFKVSGQTTSCPKTWEKRRIPRPPDMLVKVAGSKRQPPQARRRPQRTDKGARTRVATKVCSLQPLRLEQVISAVWQARQTSGHDRLALAPEFLSFFLKDLLAPVTATSHSLPPNRSKAPLRPSCPLLAGRRTSEASSGMPMGCATVKLPLWSKQRRRNVEGSGWRMLVQRDCHVGPR